MRRIAIIMMLLAAPAGAAEIQLHPLFSDNCVLQRGQPIRIWGTAQPGNDVAIALGDHRATTRADAAGNWRGELPAQTAGGPFVLEVKSGATAAKVKDVMIGDVWLCSGQSNMEWPLRKCQHAESHIAAASHPQIRLFAVPNRAEGEPQTSVGGRWHECTPDVAANFSGVAYFFGRDLHQHLKVPIGLIQSTWGGTPAQAWTSDEALRQEPSLQHYSDAMRKRVAEFDPVKAKVEYESAMNDHKSAVAKAKEEGKAPPSAPKLPNDPRRQPNPSTLYNAMIAPLIPFNVAGVIWYQGEANGSRGYEYRTLFPTMIKDWRQRWDLGDLPFLCVQLAPYGPRNADGPQWAELREAQWLATKTLPRVGMAVITDVGDKNDIHPTNKHTVGERLALLARRIAYGEKIVADGPTYSKMTIVGDGIDLTFDSIGLGLEAKDGALTGFMICGADREFVPAQAEIRGEQVRVWSPKVAAPVAVRYGWHNYCETNLFNKNGLPATPFRTDDFPLLSQPK